MVHSHYENVKNFSKRKHLKYKKNHLQLQDILKYIFLN